MKRRKNNNRKRIVRKRAAKAIKHRAILKPYIDELERSRVPPSSVRAAVTMMEILLLGGAK